MLTFCQGIGRLALSGRVATDGKRKPESCHSLLVLIEFDDADRQCCCFVRWGLYRGMFTVCRRGPPRLES
jgi:hypothetical protein